MTLHSTSAPFHALLGGCLWGRHPFEDIAWKAEACSKLGAREAPYLADLGLPLTPLLGLFSKSLHLPLQAGAPLPGVSPPPSHVASREARLSRKAFFKLNPSVTPADTADFSVFDFLLHILRANLLAWTLSEREIYSSACLS